jgi:hypothetical protein
VVASAVPMPKKRLTAVVTFSSVSCWVLPETVTKKLVPDAIAPPAPRVPAVPLPAVPAPPELAPAAAVPVDAPLLPAVPFVTPAVPGVPPVLELPAALAVLPLLPAVSPGCLSPSDVHAPNPASNTPTVQAPSWYRFQVIIHHAAELTLSQEFYGQKSQVLVI